MEPAIDALPIIDIDTHFTEPKDLWTSRAPARLKDQAPRVVEKDGAQRWIIDKDQMLSPPGFCVIKRDGGKVYGRFSLARFEEMSEAASFPKARLELMDQHGLHTQILYPNVVGFAGSALMRVEDLELRNFCISGYNDSIADFQAEGEGRIYPQALLPFWDVDLAVKELLRCKDLGLVGFTMTDSPESWKLPSLCDAHWDPLWSTAQELSMPVNFHIGSGGVGNPSWRGMDPQRSLAALSTVVFMSNVRCLANLIFSGLLDRYPELNFVSVESGIGWIPFMLEACEYQMDENFERGKGPALRPTEYFRRQIFASFWFEKRNVARTVELLGADNVMFETDFPHPTCLYPGIREHVREALDGIEPAVQKKILYETAARVYGLPLPA